MPDVAERTPAPANEIEPQPRPARATDVEPTLGAVLRSLATRRPPRHLLEGVSVALPWAGYFGYMGWWRASMAATAVGSFGVWAICERWARSERLGWRRVFAVAGRSAAATVMAVLAAILVLEIFFRLMGSSPIS